MTTTPLPSAPVLSPVELTRRWSALLDPPVFRARSLWLAWMEPDGIMLPLVVPIDDLPRMPDQALTDGLRTLHDGVAEKVGREDLHLALALCRPGPPEVDDDDVAWSEALRTGVGERIGGTWSLHLAANGTVTPVVDPPRWAWR